MKIGLRALLWLMLLMCAGVVVMFVVVGKGSSHDGGFKDVVKNPEYWDKVTRANAEVADSAAESKNWSDQKVSSVVRNYVLEQKTSRDASGEAKILRSLGARMYPTVLELLGDSSLYGRLVKPTGVDIIPEAPFHRACDLLGDSPPEKAVAALAPFLSDPSVEIRKDAALAIAKTGAPSMVPFVRKALLDQDDYVREYALMGLEFALGRDGVDETTGENLFSSVLALLRAGKNEDKASDILFGLSHKNAKSFFLSDEEFTPDSPMLAECLKTLGNANEPVPRDRLLELIKSLEFKKRKESQTDALSGALRLLGQQRNPADRDFLRARTSSPEKPVALGALNGLLSSYGLEDFEQKMEKVEEKSGIDALSKPQRFYSAVEECDAEINNGGLAQYFLNSSGDRWPDAVAGFEALGMKKRMAVLQEAISLFGREGPSTHREVRQGQLSKLYRKNDSTFDALDSRYYSCHEDVEVLSYRYVLEHSEDFH